MKIPAFDLTSVGLTQARPNKPNYTLILHTISGCDINKDSNPLWSFGLHFIGWRI